MKFRFSAAYLADVLADLGMAAVDSLGECDGSAAAGLEEQGLDVHHLGLDRSCHHGPGLNRSNFFYGYSNRGPAH